MVADGKILFCESEERFNRIKGSVGFPRLALAHVYERLLRPADVATCTLYDATVVGFLALAKHKFEPFAGSGRYHEAKYDIGLDWRAMLGDEAQLAAVAAARTKQSPVESDPAIAAKASRYFCAEIGLPPERIHRVHHHVAHAMSTWPFAQGEERTLLLTLDGTGDRLCASVAVREGKTVSFLHETREDHSLGMLYSIVTGVLGMKMNEHEYKVMGLAPYAPPAAYADLLDSLRALLWVDDDGLWRNSYHIIEVLQERLEALLRWRRFDHVAGALQAYAEEMLVRWVRAWLRRTGTRRIACAGGVFMNVKANGLIAALPEVEAMSVVPSAADESTAIGCAVYGSLGFEPETPIRPAEGIYVGRAFDAAAIDAALAATGAAERYVVHRPPDMADRVAALLSEGQVVARFAGAAEFGARALGNRSILAHPGRTETVEVINRSIKNRDFWMPFAPAVLREQAARYFQVPAGLDSPYMMFGLPTTAEGAAALPAAIHRADKTGRPQFVRRDWNPEYAAIIEAFGRRTGTWAVLNTSFNLHGEPIVGTPQDAIRTVDRSGLRWCQIGPCLIEKRAA
ncbi:MAG: carbamoyl transferase [Alphaproteobacteria bacterium]|nr:carbamoyl transferase [Alphaproteobacteria bacterium]